MIKQIWFVKNERKLINNLCIAINFVILLYAFFSVWGLENSIIQNIYKRIDLLFIPIFSLVLSLIMYYCANHVATSKKYAEERLIALHNQLKRDMLIGSNLWISLAFSFFGLNKISLAKSIDGFGLLPMYLCMAGGVIFYVIRYLNYRKSIQNKA